MSSDLHERAQFLIDESRIAGISPEDTVWLNAHLRECSECTRREEETTRMLSAMAELSCGAATVRERLVVTPRQPLPHGRGSVSIAWRWPLAAAAVLLLAAVPLYRAREAARAESDALLLERIDAHVSRTVPQALEPLMNPEPGDHQ